MDAPKITYDELKQFFLWVEKCEKEMGPKEQSIVSGRLATFFKGFALVPEAKSTIQSTIHELKAEDPTIAAEKSYIIGVFMGYLLHEWVTNINGRA